LNVLLTGTVSGNGFDTTAFTGSFQTANPSSGPGHGFPNDGLTTFTERISFGSSASVPDGGTTIMLLGVALVGLGLIKRKLLLA
jgi:hypothetical protein